MLRQQAYHEYLKSDHWKALRQAKFQEVGKACQTCPGRSVIHVHHIRYRELIDCVTSDLAVLCKECHDELHWAGQILKLDLMGVELDQIKSILSTIQAHPRYVRWKQRREDRKNGTRTRKPKPKPQQKKKPKVRVNGIICRNPCQEEIAADPWFGTVFDLERRAFLKCARAKFEGHPKRSRMIGNCCVLWQRTAYSRRLKLSA